MPHKQQSNNKNVHVVLDRPAVETKIGKDSVKMHFRCKKSYKDYTYEEISKYFDKPIKDVSDQLGVSVTFLKKVCRRLNIPRWPFRKIQALHKRITQIEETITEQSSHIVPLPTKTQQELKAKQKQLKNTLGNVLERTASSASMVSLGSSSDLNAEYNGNDEEDEVSDDQIEDDDNSEADDEAVEQQTSNAQPAGGNTQPTRNEPEKFACSTGEKPASVPSNNSNQRITVQVPKPKHAPVVLAPVVEPVHQSAIIAQHMQAFHPQNAPVVVRQQQHHVYDAPVAYNYSHAEYSPHHYYGYYDHHYPAANHHHPYQSYPHASVPYQQVYQYHHVPSVLHQRHQQHLLPLPAQPSAFHQHTVAGYPLEQQAAEQNGSSSAAASASGLPSFGDFIKQINM